ncbi:diguanylate cyclase with PAS/PAC and GAF sensors [Candidatus Vecturithrix granuli]|uniref:Diguanylate cyclase with PAS/PAC and GAF sensors n=1 Tax=Vecturithrix granuli TaxID=1499967 RepID=A0A081BV97_VECG1|nr:diguanylate cyclase with PAS/PAC and GAF sensors [Candidatus Vecturithrix granuli]
MSKKTRTELNAENAELRAQLSKVNALLSQRAPQRDMLSEDNQAERKRAEESLRESETRYRRLFETAKDGILLLDADTGQITSVNPFLIELLGYSREEFLGKRLWEIGLFKDTAASQSAFRELQQKHYIRYEELPLETRHGARVEVEFVSNIYRVNGSNVIQCNIRDISERVQARDQLRRANEDLSALVVELQKHDHDMRLINRMHDLLQICKTQAEAYQVIALAAGELFVGQSGGLAIWHASGHYLETVARWGREPLLESIFPLDDCWAMRRGQMHEVVDVHANVICRHFVRPPESGYLCLPLVVQGETLGLFYLETPIGMSDARMTRHGQLVVTVGEGIKLALSNLKLRERMHEQANQDHLTGLFNRRYLYDTLPRELHRALRHNTPVSVAMLDIDHFKQVNDTFGHDAGDRFLVELGRMLNANVRKSDLACRYGGEEFVLVLPDSSIEDSRRHLEQICNHFRELQVQHGEDLLGPLTLSVGIAQTPEHGVTADELLRAADEAMYAAKQSGRDGIVVFNDHVHRTG